MSWPFGDEPASPCGEEDGVKCYCCGDYYPESSCVANTLDEGRSVPVCKTCAEGRVGWRFPYGRIKRQHGKDNHNG